MATFLNSEDVRVFPYGQQRPTDPAGRLLNEENITRLVKSINDFDSYVISYENSNIEFVIAGYYITANISEILPTEEGADKTLWAAIDVASGATSISEEGSIKRTYSYLTGADKDGKFQAVQFSATESDDTTLKQLQLLDSEGNIPPESRKRFNVASLGIDASLKLGDIISGGDAESAGTRSGN